MDVSSMEKYCRAAQIELRSIAGESFLIITHAGESKMYSLNGMGLWFWERLATPVDKAALLAAMLEEYDVDPETAAAEVERFIAHLMAIGLVQGCAQI